MRWYEIIIKLKDGTVWIPPSMEKLGRTDVSFTSLTKDGKPNPGALDLYVDLTLYSVSAPHQGSHVILSGISLDDISIANRLEDATIEIRGGMLDGYLPLSKNFTPKILAQGTIYWVAGNWEGTNTTLALYLVSATALNPTLKDKGPITLDWLLNQKLSEPLQKVLQTMYGKSAQNPKGLDVKIAISDELVARSIFPGSYPNFEGFCVELKRFTRNTYPSIKRIDGAVYDGVEIYVNNGAIYAVDGSQQGSTQQGIGLHPFDNPLAIKFTDLIGQPAWKSFNTMVFKTVMRGDIGLSDYVGLPSSLTSPYIISTGGIGQAPQDTAGLGSASKNKIGFPGKFSVRLVRHSGQFRGADARSWVTVIDCLAPGKDLTPPVEEPPVVVQVDPDKKPNPTPTNPLNTPPATGTAGPTGIGR